MSAADATVAESVPAPDINVYLLGDMNATASFLSSATEINLFASACAVEVAYDPDPIRRKSISNSSTFSNKPYPFDRSPKVAVRAPAAVMSVVPS